MKLNILCFAVSGGIVGALSFGWITLATLIGIPGFEPFAKLLESGYGPYGYSISAAGVIIGVIWGFVEGFIWLGALALMYNKLIELKK